MIGRFSRTTLPLSLAKGWLVLATALLLAGCVQERNGTGHPLREEGVDMSAHAEVGLDLETRPLLREHVNFRTFLVNHEKL